MNTPSLSFFRRGFTLVEILVAMAILSLLVLVLGQVVVLTAQAISINSKSLDAAAQARVVLDRIGADFAARPTRTDLPMSFTRNGNNAVFQFYSGVGGYYSGGAAPPDARQFSNVGYLISSTSSPSNINISYDQLQRAAVGCEFDVTVPTDPQSLVFLPQTIPGIPASTPTSPTYEVLASDVFRLEVCYLLKTGAISNSHPPAPTNPNQQDTTDFTQVAGFIIGIGVLDDRSLKLLGSDPEAALASIDTVLPEQPEGSDPLSTWTKKLSAADFQVPGVPAAVVRNIRVYQRTFYVP